PGRDPQYLQPPLRGPGVRGRDRRLRARPPLRGLRHASLDGVRQAGLGLPEPAHRHRQAQGPRQPGDRRLGGRVRPRGAPPEPPAQQEPAGEQGDLPEVAVFYRYSQWDGTQQIAPFDADELMEALSDDLMEYGDLRSALQRLYRWGDEGRLS